MARTSIRLGDERSLLDLLRDLRGRRVSLRCHGEALRGVVISIDGA